VNPLVRTFSKQFARPRGPLGRLAARLMRGGNAPLNVWMVERLQVAPRDRVLEVGFGPGVALAALLARASEGFVTGLDASGLMVRQARARHADAIAAGRLELHAGDAGSLPFADASFDKVCGAHVIYFWPDPVATVRELRRVLRPDGTLALGYQERERMPPQAKAGLPRPGRDCTAPVRWRRSSGRRDSRRCVSRRRRHRMGLPVSACWRSSSRAAGRSWGGKGRPRLRGGERMRERQGTLTGVDGTQLNWRAWLPNGLARAAVVLVHGFGEHTGRHPALSAHLVPRGYAIWGFDLRGHGRSSGLRGHIMAWEEYRGDMDRFLALARAEEQGVPLFLYGHSLGGLIVLEYAADHPEGLAGVIALAPGLSMDLPLIQRWMVRVASRVRPTLGREQPADPQDPLMHGRSSARLVTEMRRAMARSDAAAPGCGYPCSSSTARPIP